MRYALIFLFLSLVGSLNASTDTTLVQREKVLAQMLEELRSADNDYDRDEKNQLFKEYLFETLKNKNAFTYSFTKLKSVGFIDSPDGELRIVNWNVEQENESQKYYCFLMHHDTRSKEIEISELIDNSENLPLRPDGILEANNWYGALYYQIIPIEKGAKKLYTLLGWDGNTSMSTIKLIDVLYFSGKNPKLGSPLFKTPDGTFKRMFYEHSKKTVMSLKYEKQYDRIIFDHLSPETPSLKGYYSFYVPDFSYDAFVLEGSKWVLKEDVIGVNKGTSTKTEVYVKNEKSGKIERKEIKNKWENPEDAKAPGGGSSHVAITPEKDPKNVKAQEEKTSKQKGKKDKRDPNQLSTTMGTQKRKKNKN